MKARILKINKNSIEKTAEILKQGGICVYPTETCYGLGCDATNEKAIRKLRKIKKMGKNKKISIIVSDLEMMKQYGVINNRVKRIVNLFMPAPLTLIVKKKNSIPDMLNKDEIAFRIPNNIIALNLVERMKKPITATSANITKEGCIYKIDKIIKVFEDKVDIILNAGNLPRVLPSTIIDIKKKKIEVIRKGPIKTDLIKKLDRIKN